MLRVGGRQPPTFTRGHAAGPRGPGPDAQAGRVRQAGRDARDLLAACSVPDARGSTRLSRTAGHVRAPGICRREDRDLGPAGGQRLTSSGWYLPGSPGDELFGPVRARRYSPTMQGGRPRGRHCLRGRGSARQPSSRSFPTWALLWEELSTTLARTRPTSFFTLGRRARARWRARDPPWWPSRPSSAAFALDVASDTARGPGAASWAGRVACGGNTSSPLVSAAGLTSLPPSPAVRKPAQRLVDLRSVGAGGEQTGGSETRSARNGCRHREGTPRHPKGRRRRLEALHASPPRPPITEQPRQDRSVRE